MKGNVTIDIKKSDYVYIDGATGKQLTKEEFNRRHNKGIRNVLGGNRVKVQGKEEQGGEGEA